MGNYFSSQREAHRPYRTSPWDRKQHRLARERASGGDVLGLGSLVGVAIVVALLVLACLMREAAR